MDPLAVGALRTAAPDYYVPDTMQMRPVNPGALRFRDRGDSITRDHQAVVESPAQSIVDRITVRTGLRKPSP